MKDGSFATLYKEVDADHLCGEFAKQLKRLHKALLLGNHHPKAVKPTWIFPECFKSCKE